jgi:hypothetical protein
MKKFFCIVFLLICLAAGNAEISAQPIVRAATTTTVYTAASEALMLALAAKVGDFCVRSDVPTTYILRVLPANLLASWTSITTLSGGTPYAVRRVKSDSSGEEWSDIRTSYNATDYSPGTQTSSSISAGITAISTGELVLKKGTWTVDSNVVVPSGVTLKFQRGAILNIDPGHTVSFAVGSSFEAGRWQIFSGTGTVVFAAGVIETAFPEWWYASGSYDAAMQFAVDCFSGPGLVKLMPNKTYPLVSGFTVSKHRVWIDGAGPNSSIFSFTPVGTASAVKFQSADAFAIAQCGITGVGFIGYGNQIKTAIELVDVDRFDIKNVAIGSGGTWTDTTYASKGVHIKGRDFITVDRSDIYASIPIHVSVNPLNGIDLDHSWFTHLSLTAESTNPNIKVDTAVDLYNSYFMYSAWNLGGHGFQWVDTTGGGVGTNLTFRGIRWEQSVNPTGYIIDIEHNFSFHKVTIDDVYGGLNTQGIKLKKVAYPTIIQYEYTGAGVALETDAFSRPLVLLNCFITAGTLTMTGLTKIYGSGASTAAGIAAAFEIWDTPAVLSAHYFGNLSTFDTNALAIAGGLTAGKMYKTSTGVLMVVY